ncbi:hypothetical protein [Halovenus marina]|uniref:hypothetical protein n=1 Tax=Halovenus marina TaxID=3396621 RepID=UPI003F568567
MEEKTAELRDIFLDVAEDETVTESQEETRGSLIEGESVETRLESIIERMREEFSFRTGLTDDEYEQLVRQFYEGRSDAEIGADLDRSPETVFWARMDLHLTRETALDELAVGSATVRDRHAEGVTAEQLADECELDEGTAERALAIVDTQQRARRVSYRFRTAFEETLTDADMTVQLVSDAHEDGLEEATEDAEVDVEF